MALGHSPTRLPTLVQSEPRPAEAALSWTRHKAWSSALTISEGAIHDLLAHRLAGDGQGEGPLNTSPPPENSHLWYKHPSLKQYCLFRVDMACIKDGRAASPFVEALPQMASSAALWDSGCIPPSAFCCTLHILGRRGTTPVEPVPKRWVDGLLMPFRQRF